VSGIVAVDQRISLFVRLAVRMPTQVFLRRYMNSMAAIKGAEKKAALRQSLSLQGW
jgi:hypothetical protein